MRNRSNSLHVAMANRDLVDRPLPLGVCVAAILSASALIYSALIGGFWLARGLF
jgi:hypothetical protein